MNWIKRIEKYLMEESVLNVQVLMKIVDLRTMVVLQKINKIFKMN